MQPCRRESGRRRSLRSAGRENGNIRSLGEFDHHSRGFTVLLVVLCQLGAETAGLHADDGIGLGIEGVAAMEHRHADRVLFERLRASGERLLDDVAEEASERFCVPELTAGENMFQRRYYRGVVRPDNALLTG